MGANFVVCHTIEVCADVCPSRQSNSTAAAYNLYLITSGTPHLLRWSDNTITTGGLDSRNRDTQFMLKFYTVDKTSNDMYFEMFPNAQTDLQIVVSSDYKDISLTTTGSVNSSTGYTHFYPVPIDNSYVSIYVGEHKEALLSQKSGQDAIGVTMATSDPTQYAHTFEYQEYRN